jgi:hypothetical protein
VQTPNKDPRSLAKRPHLPSFIKAQRRTLPCRILSVLPVSIKGEAAASLRWPCCSTPRSYAPDPFCLRHCHSVVPNIFASSTVKSHPAGPIPSQFVAGPWTWIQSPPRFSCGPMSRRFCWSGTSNDTSLVALCASCTCFSELARDQTSRAGESSHEH